ncbi:hypothetical protein V3C99_006313 [Haemonchus contortus]
MLLDEREQELVWFLYRHQNMKPSAIADVLKTTYGISVGNKQIRNFLNRVAHGQIPGHRRLGSGTPLTSCSPDNSAMVCNVVGDEPTSTSDDIKIAWQKLLISSVRKAIEEFRDRVQVFLILRVVIFRQSLIKFDYIGGTSRAREVSFFWAPLYMYICMYVCVGLTENS